MMTSNIRGEKSEVFYPPKKVHSTNSFSPPTVAKLTSTIPRLPPLPMLRRHADVGNKSPHALACHHPPPTKGGPLDPWYRAVGTLCVQCLCAAAQTLCAAAQSLCAKPLPTALQGGPFGQTSMGLKFCFGVAPRPVYHTSGFYSAPAACLNVATF